MSLTQTIAAEIGSYIAAAIGMMLLYYVRKLMPAVFTFLEKKLEGTKFELDEKERQAMEEYFNKLVLRTEERVLAESERSLNMDLDMDGDIGETSDEMVATPSTFQSKRQSKKLELALAQARERYPDKTEEELLDMIEDAVARMPGLGATGRRGIADPRMSAAFEAIR